MRDELFSKEKQLDLRLACIKRTLDFGLGDYIPGMFVNMGCIGIESALGMEIHYGDSPEQMPGICEYLLDGFDRIGELKLINPNTDGMIPEFLERVRYFTNQTEHKIPVSCLDMNGPMPISIDIVGSENFLMGMYNQPEELEYLLSFVVDNIILVTDACIEAAGGVDNITCTDFCDMWFPEGKKGHVSDDVCAMYKPEFFERFSIPVNNRIFEKYGPGLLHNCGPNPCVSQYLNHTPRISGADLAYKFSKEDLPTFRKAFAGQGVIYLGLYCSSHEEYVCEYRHIMDALAPDVIAVTQINIDENLILSGKIDPVKLHKELYKLSKEYARCIWG